MHLHCDQDDVRREMPEEEAKQKYKRVLTIIESEWLACEGLYLCIYLFIYVCMFLFSRFSMKYLHYSWIK